MPCLKLSLLQNVSCIMFDAKANKCSNSLQPTTSTEPVGEGGEVQISEKICKFSYPHIYCKTAQ